MRFGVTNFGPGLFRMVLASAVFLAHVSRFDFGRPAVMLFFMLSGFWVAKMQDGPHHQKYVSYLISRFLRIWPQMAVTAVVILIVYFLLGIPAPGNLLSTLGLLGLATRRDDVIGVVWSLDIESQFYILLPAVLLLQRFIGRPWKLALISLGVFTLGCAVFIESQILSVLVYFPMFAVGISVYLHKWKASKRVAVGSLLVGFGVVAILNWPSFHFGNVLQFHRDIIFMGASLLFAPFVSWNVSQSSDRFDRFLGNLSYPLYLVHEPCNFVARTFLPKTLAKVIALLGSICSALLLYITIDRPTERFRAMLRKRSMLPAHSGAEKFDLSRDRQT